MRTVRCHADAHRGRSRCKCDRHCHMQGMWILWTIAGKDCCGHSRARWVMESVPICYLCTDEASGTPSGAGTLPPRASEQLIGIIAQGQCLATLSNRAVDYTLALNVAGVSLEQDASPSRTHLLEKRGNLDDLLWSWEMCTGMRNGFHACSYIRS
jgi:hypothetical protein